MSVAPGRALVPLRIAPRRFWLWGLVFALTSAAVISSTPWARYVDFPQFWAAGRTVGTPDLLDPARHAAWEMAHGVPVDTFPYPPGAAWLFAPFATSTMGPGFWLEAAAMTVALVVAGLLGARAFGLDWRVALMAAFAWGPCMASVSLGQNATLALALVLLATEGLRRDNDWLAGLAAGLLLYKPTVALAAVPAIVWYFIRVAAPAGDWGWPGTLWAALGDWYRTSTAFNASKATSIPGLLVGHGVPEAIGYGLALVVLALSIPRLLRAPLVEAAAGATLVGLVVSPHSLMYEGALALPILLWAISDRGIAEPARTRLILAAYVAGLAWMPTMALGLSSVAVVALAATAIWIWGGWRADAAPVSGAAVSSPHRGGQRRHRRRHAGLSEHEPNSGHLGPAESLLAHPARGPTRG
jgi:hypothetical protein